MIEREAHSVLGLPQPMLAAVRLALYAIAGYGPVVVAVTEKK